MINVVFVIAIIMIIIVFHIMIKTTTVADEAVGSAIGGLELSRFLASLEAHHTSRKYLLIS